MRCLTLVSFLAIGCGTQSGTEKRLRDTGEPQCDETQTTLALDEVSPLGFSGQDVLDWLGLGAEAPVTWSDGSASTIRFTFAEGERGVGFTDFGPVDSGATCEEPDLLWVGVAYTITSFDGRLTEEGDYTVRAADLNSARLVTNTFGTGGPLDDCPVGDGYEQEIDAAFTPDGTTGDLFCEGESNWTIGSW